jgi:hypothetical protein
MSFDHYEQSVTTARPTAVEPASPHSVVRARDEATATPLMRSFTRARRVVVRLHAKRITNRMIDELEFRLEPRRRGEPLFVRLDALAARYEALGGDPSDLPR